MSTRLTILGSGTSHGIPMIACDCRVCASPDPRDQRTRVSALFSFDDHHVLIDTPPELRLQCVARSVRRVDAVLFTHAHADHVVGLDDIRRFNDLGKGPINVHGSAETLGRVRQMFDYAFIDDPDYPSHKPTLIPVAVEGPFELFGHRVTPIPYKHGPIEVFGYRVGNMAYCPDCNFIPDESLKLLRDLDVLILGALRRRPHPTHFNLEQAVEEAKRIGAGQTFFTHIAHELLHAEVCAELPSRMALAYDGLVCESE